MLVAVASFVLADGSFELKILSVIGNKVLVVNGRLNFILDMFVYRLMMSNKYFSFNFNCWNTHFSVFLFVFSNRLFFLKTNHFSKA